MEISKIKIQNIRCFDKLEVDLDSSEGVKKWLVILGDNGTGKSTLLRSIAIGLCEQSGASALIAEVAGDWIREGADEAKIFIELLPNKNSAEKGSIETIIRREPYNEISVTQIVLPKSPVSFAWEKLFVCGYGAARSVYGSSDVSEYAVTDSVYSLFNYNADLQNPELCLRRIQAETNISEILVKLSAILVLEEGSVQLTRAGISVKGPWGNSMLLNTLSDGYKSTLSWILDMYGWKLLMEEHLGNIEMKGIVILDEIEKHLHPRWQKQLIKLLSEQFPEIQFITSTHSPLCVVGTTDLRDENCSILVLQQIANAPTDKSYNVSLPVSGNITGPPRGKRADQVLTSYLFDLYTSGDDSTKASIEEYSELYKNNKRTGEEEKRFQLLLAQLNNVLGSPETALEKIVEDAVSRTLASMSENAISQLKANDPQSLEIKRQLKTLFSQNDKD